MLRIDERLNYLLVAGVTFAATAWGFYMGDVMHPRYYKENRKEATRKLIPQQELHLYFDRDKQSYSNMAGIRSDISWWEMKSAAQPGRGQIWRIEYQLKKHDAKDLPPAQVLPERRDRNQPGMRPPADSP